MEIPHVNEIQKAIYGKKLDNDKNTIDKMNVYKNKLQNASNEYYKNIIDAVKKAIELMSNAENNGHIRLNNEDFNKSIKWDEYKKICWHWMHYGFIRKGWRSRDISAWDRFGIKRPFIRAQKDLKEKGWYLVDLSNPDRSFGVYIYLYSYPPEKMKLWHGLN
jgi:hypothetical protein